MSIMPTYVNGSEAPRGDVGSIKPASPHKVEWGGFLKRRDQAQAQPVQKPAVQRGATGDGLVVVGKGANIVGEITNCSQVEIAGSLEGKVVAEAVIIREGGCLKGHVCSQRAEVHGTIEGEVQVADHLDIRSTGDVSGELTYGKLSVASGGRLAGSLEIISGKHVHAGERETAKETEPRTEQSEDGMFNGAPDTSGTVAAAETAGFDVWAGR